MHGCGSFRLKRSLDAGCKDSVITLRSIECPWTPVTHLPMHGLARQAAASSSEIPPSSAPVASEM